MKNLNYQRRGYGTPLLLVHGLGGNMRSWAPIINALSCERDVIAVDLPGFGETPLLDEETTIANLADTLTEFLAGHGLLGVDAVGSSLGARIVLELARRGEVVGSTIALNPEGFWQGIERHSFYASVFAAIRMIRALQPVMPEVLNSRTARTALLAPFSSRPNHLPCSFALQEMRSFAQAPAFDHMLYQLAYGEKPHGAPFGSIETPLVIAWGRQDRICFPYEADRALKLFPDARLRWFNHCGHFPQWDAPEEVVQLIRENTGRQMLAKRFKHSKFKFGEKIPEPAQSRRSGLPAS